MVMYLNLLISSQYVFQFHSIQTKLTYNVLIIDNFDNVKRPDRFIMVPV